MAILDILIIIAYLIILIVIGVVVSKSIKTNEDAVVGGKSFGPLTAAVGKTANLAGGPTIVGGAGYGYDFGFGGSWFGISSMLATWSTAPFAGRIWKAMHRGDMVSIGGYIGHRFGKFAHVFCGITNGLAYTGFVAAQIVATGKILNVLIGWDLTFSMIFTTFVVMGYTMLGGLKAVVYTDYVQLAIMIVGLFIVLMPVSIKATGGWDQMMAQLPDIYHNWGSMGWATIIGTIIIPTALAGFTMQASFSYIGASKNLKTSWTSSLLAGVFYAIIAGASIVIGMAAKILYPAIDSQDALATAITNMLPHGLIGLLLAAVLSATMSTAATCSISAATNIGVDIIAPLRKKPADTTKALRTTRILIAVVTLVALSFALFYPQIIGLLLMGYSLGAGGLLIPVFATMFWKRANTPGIIASMIGGGVTYLVLSKLVTWPPLFASIPVSIILLVAVSLATPPQDPEKYEVYFDDVWELNHEKEDY